MATARGNLWWLTTKNHKGETMAIKLCINCKTRPVHIDKRGLCRTCYQRLYKKGKTKLSGPGCRPTIYKVQHTAEVEFVQDYPKSQNLIYLPCLFRFDGTSYQPDFYDRERNTFYEIIGSRQRWHQIQSKLNLFKQAYPEINLKIIFYKTEDQHKRSVKYSWGTEVDIRDLEL